MKKIPSVDCFTHDASIKLSALAEKMLAQDQTPYDKEIVEKIQAMSRESKDNAEIIKLSKEIFKKLKTQNVLNNTNLIGLFCEAFVLCHPKLPCKKLFARLLWETSFNHSTVSDHVHRSISRLLSENESSTSPTIHILQTLEQTCHSFPVEVVSRFAGAGVQFAKLALEKLRISLKQMSDETSVKLGKSLYEICETLKCAILLVQKSQFAVQQNGQLAEDADHSSMLQYFADLRQECLFLLQNDTLGWECWNAAGLLLSYLIKIGNTSDQYFDKAQTLFKQNQESHLWQRNVCSGAYVAVCNGFLVTLNADMLNNSETTSPAIQNGIVDENEIGKALGTSKEAFLLSLVLERLVDIQEKISSVADQISIVKCVVQWTLTTRNLVSALQHSDWAVLLPSTKWLQSYIVLSLDSSVDVIRHQARDALVNFLYIENCKKSVLSETSNFAEDLVHNALMWDWHKRSVFVAFQCVLDYVTIEFILNHQPGLQRKLLLACCSQTLAPYASQLYSRLAEKHSEEMPKCDDLFENQMEFWFKPALNLLASCETGQARLLLEYCVTNLLKFYGSKAVAFAVSFLKKKDENLENMSQKHEQSNLKVLITCLRAAQRLGLLQSPPATTANDTATDVWREIASQQTIKSALVHFDFQIRLDSVSLLCESWKPSVLVTETDINLLKYCLPYNMNSQCPAFRQSLFNILKKFLNRLIANKQSLMKKNNEKKGKTLGLVAVYLDFMRWLLKFCFDQLFVGACYPRRSLALNILDFIMNSLIKTSDDLEIGIKSFTATRVKMLVGLLKDNYEDNRILALNILSGSIAKAHVKRTLGDSFLWDFLQSSLEAGRSSCKPETCQDAAYNLRLIARLHHDLSLSIISMAKYFISCLREDVRMAGSNLSQAVTKAPMHGSLYCLRMLLSEANLSDKRHCSVYRKLVASCIELCYEVSTAVFPVVACDSPEGCIPKPADENPLPDGYHKRYHALLRLFKPDANIGDGEKRSEDNTISQAVLVTCWRSAKESYLLLNLLASRSPLDSSSKKHDGILSWQQFLGIGKHLRKHLLETVHRGTFEVAYSAFRDYCPLLWRNKHKELSSYPKQWVVSAVEEICDPAKAQSVCVTRRSAGLPFLLRALLGSDKGTASAECLDHVMSSVLPLVRCDVIVGVTDETSCASQIHALNVLRGLMVDSSLGEEILPYVAQCLMVAVTGFECRIWAIRNSSTLLFSALMMRVFGVKLEKDLECSGKNRLSSLEFFTRMPELEQFLRDRLEVGTKDNSSVCDVERHASLYPVLLLLSRVYPSPSRQQSSNDILTSYQPLLKKCCNSPILKCRVMSSTALVNIIPKEDCSKLLSQVTKSLRNDMASNQLHGTLLLISKLLSKYYNEHEDVPTGLDRCLAEVIDVLCEKSSLGAQANPCLVTRSAFVDLVKALATACATSIPPDQGGSGDGIWRRIDQVIGVLIIDSQDFLNKSKMAIEPGHTCWFESIGKLTAFAFLRLRKLECITSSLISGNFDMSYSILRVLNEQLNTQLPLFNTAAGDLSKLEDSLISFLTSESDTRCTSQVCRLLASLSLNRSEDILRLTRPLVREMTFTNDALAGAIITCQATCLLKILTTYNSLSDSILKDLCDWLVLLSGACSVMHNDPNVRVKVANSLRRLAKHLLIDSQKRIGDLCCHAWRILFVLLVDEDLDVRQTACLIVHEVAAECAVGKSDEPCTDALSLEIAMDCFVKLHGSTGSKQFEAVLDHVINMSPNESKEVDDAPNERGPRLFNPGVANSFLEKPVLLRVVQNARVRIAAFAR